MTDNQPTLPPAGWYDEVDSAFQRYWDGAAWTDQRRPHGQARRSWSGGRVAFLVIGCIMAALGIGGLSGLGSSDMPVVDAILPVILLVLGLATAWRAISSK